MQSKLVSIKSQIYEKIHEDILTCHLKPGSSFSESQLANYYQVGRMPLREAIQQLCHEGLLESIPYKGYFVTNLSIDELKDSIDLREILETYAAKIAAKRITSAQLEKLKQIPEATFTSGDLHSYKKYVELNREFHLRVVEAAGNKKLLKQISTLLSELFRYMFATLDLGQEAYLNPEHNYLISALEKKDSMLAEEIMRSHIQKSREQILQKWNKFELENENRS